MASGGSGRREWGEGEEEGEGQAANTCLAFSSSLRVFRQGFGCRVSRSVSSRAAFARPRCPTPLPPAGPDWAPGFWFGVRVGAVWVEVQRRQSLLLLESVRAGSIADSVERKRKSNPRQQAVLALGLPFLSSLPFLPCPALPRPALPCPARPSCTAFHLAAHSSRTTLLQLHVDIGSRYLVILSITPDIGCT